MTKITIITIIAIIITKHKEWKLQKVKRGRFVFCWAAGADIWFAKSAADLPRALIGVVSAPATSRTAAASKEQVSRLHMSGVAP